MRRDMQPCHPQHPVDQLSARYEWDPKTVIEELNRRLFEPLSFGVVAYIAITR